MNRLNAFVPVPACLSAAAIILLASPSPAPAEPAAPSGQQQSGSQHDGLHDFDFLNGHWKFHLKRQTTPLTDFTKWVEYDGMATVQSLMGGRAQLLHIAGSNPETHKSIENAALRLYNPETRLWKLYLIGVKTGTVLMPPAVGRLDDKGRGIFYDYEIFRGHAVLVRYLWAPPKGDSIRFEQAFSTDAGETWETNWIYTATRIK